MQSESENPTYVVEEEPIVLSKALLDTLLKDNYEPQNLISLYVFYYYTAKWQKTNQPYCTISYIGKTFNWNDKKVRRVKNKLKKLGLVEDVERRGNGNKIIGHYVKINFIWKQSTLEKNAGVQKMQGCKNYQGNALSSVSTNALNSNNGKNEKSPDFSAFIHELYAKIIEKFEEEEIPATQPQKRKWLETLEKLQRLDGRSEEEILNVISWLKNNDFWAGNFHSILKLRRKDKDGTQFFKRFITEMKKEKSSAKKEKNGDGYYDRNIEQPLY